MSKHTPGPWSVKAYGYTSGYQADIFIESSDGAICAVWAPESNPIQKANARLIAAAPELLAALRAIPCIECGELMGEGRKSNADFCECDDARAAIAKAEGKQP